MTSAQLLPLRGVKAFKTLFIPALFFLAASSAVTPVQANNLTIATLGEPTSVDPHHFLFATNDALRRYAFESLMTVDATGKVQPELAESFVQIDDTHWEVKLRKNVKFHDGSDFDVQDVIYSICRIRATKGSFLRYTSQIINIAVKDSHTFVIDTGEAYPLLPSEMGIWGVISAPATDISAMDLNKPGCGLTVYPNNSDFDNGRVAIGTGPYKLKKFVRGSEASFARNENYWGPKQDWDNVSVRPVSSTAARVAGLVAGDFDLIEAPTAQDFARLAKDSRFTVTSSPNYDVRYIMFDHFAEPSPAVKGTNGKNPFKDIRVREAVSKAINRPAIIERILGGHGVIATNIQGKESFGFNPDIKPVAYDLAKAKSLMKEAGYADGFQMTLAVSNDYDGPKVAQTVAQMLSQIGITVEVENLPSAMFFSRRDKFEYSAYLYVIGTRTAEHLTAIRTLLATRGVSPGFGAINGGRYNSKALNDTLLKAKSAIDDKTREQLLREANRIVMDDYAVVLIEQRYNLWAHKAGVRYTPGLDGYTFASAVRKKAP